MAINGRDLCTHLPTTNAKTVRKNMQNSTLPLSVAGWSESAVFSTHGKKHHKSSKYTFYISLAFKILYNPSVINTNLLCNWVQSWHFIYIFRSNGQICSRHCPKLQQNQPSCLENRGQMESYPSSDLLSRHSWPIIHFL